jgi:hypothetical protein
LGSEQPTERGATRVRRRRSTTECVGPEPERAVAFQLIASPADDLQVAFPGDVEGRREQAALADARLAFDGDNHQVASGRPGHGVAQHVELRVAALGCGRRVSHTRSEPVADVPDSIASTAGPEHRALQGELSAQLDALREMTGVHGALFSCWCSGDPQ